MRPHAGQHGENGRRRDSQHPARGKTVAGPAIALLLLAFAASGLPGWPLAVDGAYAAPLPAGTDTPTPTSMPTATATPTATPTPPPLTLTLVSPTVKQGQASAQGPSGANVTITGANFTVAQVAIFAASKATCDAQLATLGSVATTNGAFSDYTFVWPTLPPQQYYICGTGMTSGAPGFYEVTSATPTLALSTAAVQPGQMVTITGSNFFGAGPIDVTLHSSTTVVSIQSSVTPDGNGSFSIQYTPDANLTGEDQIVAASPSDKGVTPALQARAYLNVLPAASTATVGITPTAQGISTPKSSGAAPPSPTGDNTGLMVLIAAIVGGLLIALGVLAFFLLRRRTGGSPAPGYAGGNGGPGGYGGYTGGVPTTFGQRQTGRPVGLDIERNGAYGQGMKMGAVAQWEEESRPGPDWQPRPMSGHPRYDETPMPEYGDDYPTDASRYAEAGGYELDDYRPENAPPDPWADPAEADDPQGGRGATNPANYADEEWTQVQPRRQEPDPTDWHKEPGLGTTRPDGAGDGGVGDVERGTNTEDTKDTEVHRGI